MAAPTAHLAASLHLAALLLQPYRSRYESIQTGSENPEANSFFKKLRIQIQFQKNAQIPFLTPASDPGTVIRVTVHGGQMPPGKEGKLTYWKTTKKVQNMARNSNKRNRAKRRKATQLALRRHSDLRGHPRHQTALLVIAIVNMLSGAASGVAPYINQKPTIAMVTVHDGSTTLANCDSGNRGHF